MASVSHGERLGQAGHALEQAVAAGEQADDQALDAPGPGRRSTFLISNSAVSSSCASSVAGPAGLHGRRRLRGASRHGRLGVLASGLRSESRLPVP